MNHSSYLEVLDPRLRDRKVEECFYKIVDAGWQFDCIATTGLSGNIIGIELARAFDVSIAIVRKQGESHHGKQVESTAAHRDSLRYIIVDDFVGCGTTIKRVRDTMYSEYSGMDWSQDEYRHHTPPILVGVVLHSSMDNNETMWDGVGYVPVLHSKRLT